MKGQPAGELADEAIEDLLLAAGFGRIGRERVERLQDGVGLPAVFEDPPCPVAVEGTDLDQALRLQDVDQCPENGVPGEFHQESSKRRLTCG